MHIQKTAGSTLIHRVRHHFAPEEVYPSRGEIGRVDPAITVEHLERRWASEHDTLRVVAGHFPLCTTERLGGGFTTLTVLREPVERTLSFLRHFRERTPSAQHLHLEEIYDDPFRFRGLIHNHSVKMLGMASWEMTAGVLTSIDFTPDHLDRARRNLVSLDVIGLQERFEDLCGELSSRFGWRLGPPAYRNRTEPGSVSEAFRRRIAEDNAFDVELYEFGRSIVEQRAS